MPETSANSPRFARTAPDLAAMCSVVLAAPAPCCHGGVEVAVLRWGFPDVLHKRPWLLHFTRYHQSVQQAPRTAPFLQASRKGFCSAVNFNCSFEIGEN